MHRENLYESFFNLLVSVYTLDGNAVYSYTDPLFDTWTPPSAAEEASHHFTILQDADEQSTSDEEILSDGPIPNREDDNADQSVHSAVSDEIVIGSISPAGPDENVEHQ